MNIGYACINMTLRSEGVYTSRGLKLATLNKKGISYASELAVLNIKDLITILKWNEKNNIHLFRLGSDIIPWGSKLDITKFPDYDEMKELFAECNKIITRSNQRITFHPGPFNLLASPKESVVQNTIDDLSMHGLIFDLLGLSNTVYNKINIHVSATYGDKLTACKTWIKNFNRLPDNVKNRLTVENDDKANSYSVRDLYNLIHSETGVPIVFDYHHHSFCTGDLSEEQALNLALSTWPKDITPIVHYSESKSLHENNSKINPRAHSDLINGPINTYNKSFDIMIEAKGKELALINYNNNLLIN